MGHTQLLRNSREGRVLSFVQLPIQDATKLRYHVTNGVDEEERVTDNGEHPWVTYGLFALLAVLSGIGYLFSGQWIEGASPSSKAGLAVLRTLFTFAPAVLAFAIAARHRRKAEQRMATQLDKLRHQLEQYVRVQSVQNEIDTVERLAKVARSAVVQTGNSSKELFGAISHVTDHQAKERLLERFRRHADGLVTVLTAVNEQMTESGRKIYEGLTADASMHIIDRADYNAEKGLEYAEKVIQKRGIRDGMSQINSSIEQARLVQSQLTATTEQITSISLGPARAIELSEGSTK